MHLLYILNLKLLWNFLLWKDSTDEDGALKKKSNNFGDLIFYLRTGILFQLTLNYAF